MMYLALGFGLWFVFIMALGAARKWSIPARIAGVLSVPALGCLAAAILM